MTTRLVAWPNDSAEQDDLLTEAARLLQCGQVVGLPTDTVYGLAAHPDQDQAVDALYALKGRPREKAIALLVGRPGDIDELATNVPRAARALAERYWPGGLTLVLWSAVDPSSTIALRMPNHPVPLGLIEKVGSHLATTSANRSAAASPRTAQDVLAQIPSGFPLLIDAGPCSGGLDSTVVDLTGSSVRVLRQGAISWEELQSAISSS